MEARRVDSGLRIHAEAHPVQDAEQRCGNDSGPPGEPVTKLSWPSRTRMVGVMELRGRLPGPIALASD